MPHPLWNIRADTTYLNHGSFGPPSRPVVEARLQWQEQLDLQPMEVFVRQQETALLAARDRLASWLSTDSSNLAFVDNATWAMNVVAHSFPLQPGDRVVLTDHEYGAVERIWQRAAGRSSAEVVQATLPGYFSDAQQVVDAILQACDARTRLIVVSQITSPTAITLPVKLLCEQARRRGIVVCIDGPHALVQLDLSLDELGCGFYTASCHKWLSAAFGSGFLYVAPEFHSLIESPLLSWGRIPPSEPVAWHDEFLWLGTRDNSAFLTVPVAIDVFEQIGLENFRDHSHSLAQYARDRLEKDLGCKSLVEDDPAWYMSMAHLELPLSDASRLQQQLWQQFQVEVPIICWQDRWFIRVSCHLYNDESQLDKLIGALKSLTTNQ